VGVSQIGQSGCPFDAQRGSRGGAQFGAGGRLVPTRYRLPGRSASLDFARLSDYRVILNKSSGDPFIGHSWLIARD
jgi:hypothetical protein